MNVHRLQPPDHDQPIAIDECGQCGGFWMDEGEANLVCPLVAYLDKRHFEIIGLGKAGGGIARCPRCADTPVAFRLLDIEVDYCPSCNGVWLEGHEAEGRVNLEDGTKTTGGRGPYRAIERAATTDVASCAGCSQRERTATMFMAAEGLVCRACYATAINRVQQRRADEVGAAQSIVGQIIESLVNAFLRPLPDATRNR
jgi:Zn-finger nucleic acid-binding protein